MKNGFQVFLAVAVTLGLSWCGFVLAPAIQLGALKQEKVLNSTDVYPVQRQGDATLGLQIYRANGCAACHTEQVRQSGFSCDVILTGSGKNPTAVSNVISGLKLTGLTKDQADLISEKITTAGGKVETHINTIGTDISRGLGIRRSVAEDFLYDAPVQLGDIRVGPDLANVGMRLGDLNWQLLHLYAPKAVVKDSAMPSYKFLFDVRPKVNGQFSADALQNLPKEFAPADGYEVVPTTQAKQLAAYLLSLRADVPLHDAPFTAITSKKNP